MTLTNQQLTEYLQAARRVDPGEWMDTFYININHNQRLRVYVDCVDMQPGQIDDPDDDRVTVWVYCFFDFDGQLVRTYTEDDETREFQQNIARSNHEARTRFQNAELPY